MPLTQEQIDRMDKLTGLDNNSVQTNRLQELQARVSSQPKSFAEKVLDFTGGKEIAQGLGQAIANPEISKQIEETQKQQFEIQGNLIKAIRAKRAEGEDTTKLDKALSDLTIEISKTGTGAEKLLNQDEITTKQVLGDALQLGTTIASVGTFGAGAKGLTTGVLGKAKPSVVTELSKGVGIVKGTIQGAKTGAIAGGAFGASTGVSQGLQEDKSIADIAKEGVIGGIGGGITGGILGGVIGGVTGGIKGTQIKKATKEDTFLKDLVSPKMTEQVKIRALKEGRVTEQGLLSASKITPSKRDLQLADAVKDIVSSKNSLPQNLQLIESKVDDINTGVKAYVKVNKVPFNTNQLTSQLNKGRDELKLVFASDATAKKTYDALVKEFVKLTKNKDTSGLLDARQAFDNLPAVKKLLNSQALGENARKEISLTVRSMANKYIASLLPKGNQYRETLLKEHKMLEVIKNMAEKGTDLIGTNKLQTLTQKYPILKYWTSLAIGAGGVGVGSVIIGSSD